MNLDYIEIGTANFDTILQKSEKKGISIDPLKIYLDRLPNKENNIKINVAISNTKGKTTIYYIHPDDIEKYNLPFWVRRCNSIGKKHPSVEKLLNENGFNYLFKEEEIDTITWDCFIKNYNIISVEEFKIDIEGHDTVIIESILSSITNILPKKITFVSNVLTEENKINSTISKLIERGYFLIEKNDQNTTVEFTQNYPSKIIFSCNDSHYSKFWKINSEICAKILNITPVLLQITDSDSDFEWDEYGIIKKIKKENSDTSTYAQTIRLYSGKYFENEILMLSDIDLFLFDKFFLIEKLIDHHKFDVTIIGSDAYDSKRKETKEWLLCSDERFPICYIVCKGFILNKIMNITKEDDEKSFFLKNNFYYGWDSDEIIFTKNLLSLDLRINRVKRNFRSTFYLHDRIEKYMFQKNVGQEGMRLNIQELNNLEGFIECHCPNYYEYENEILKIKKIIFSE